MLRKRKREREREREREVSLSPPSLSRESSPFIKNSETRLIRGRKLIIVTQWYLFDVLENDLNVWEWQAENVVMILTFFHFLLFLLFLSSHISTWFHYNLLQKQKKETCKKARPFQSDRKLSLVKKCKQLSPFMHEAKQKN